MSIKIPVYTEEFGTHKITIYQEMDDGTFRKTSTQLLREFRHNIESISVHEGEIVSKRYDRTEREWETPTAIHNYGRPRSFYAFSREQIKKNKIYVGATSSMHGRIMKFALHELRFKPTTSQAIKMLAARKYREAVDLMEVESNNI